MLAYPLFALAVATAFIAAVGDFGRSTLTHAVRTASAADVQAPLLALLAQAGQQHALRLGQAASAFASAPDVAGYGWRTDTVAPVSAFAWGCAALPEAVRTGAGCERDPTGFVALALLTARPDERAERTALRQLVRQGYACRPLVLVAGELRGPTGPYATSGGPAYLCRVMQGS